MTASTLSHGANLIQKQHELNLAQQRQRQSAFRRCACIATPVVGLVAGVGAYALASGVHNSNYGQPDTYQLNLVNGLSGAAGVVGGALVSWLAAKGVQAYCCVRDRVAAALPATRDHLAQPVNAADLEDQEVQPQDFEQPEGIPTRGRIGVEPLARQEYEYKNKTGQIRSASAGNQSSGGGAGAEPSGGVELNSVTVHSPPQSRDCRLPCF